MEKEDKTMKNNEIFDSEVEKNLQIGRAHV